MARTLAKGRRRVDFLATASAPSSWSTPTVTEMASSVALSCIVLKDGFTLGFTDSDTVSEPALCETANPKTLDASNFEAKITLFRFLTGGDAPDTSGDDAAFTALSTKGTTGWLIERISPLPLATTAWTTGDKIRAYPVITDNPQDPSDDSGWLKTVIPFLPNGDPIVGTLTGA